MAVGDSTLFVSAGCLQTFDTINQLPYNGVGRWGPFLSLYHLPHIVKLVVSLSNFIIIIIIVSAGCLQTFDTKNQLPDIG